MKHLKLSALILSVSVIAGCKQAHIIAAPSQPAVSEPQGKEDFYLTGYKNHSGPSGMDVFTFAHQGRTFTATCEMDGGNGSCSGLISKVGQHLFGSDEIRDYKDNSIAPTTNGQLVIFPGPAKPAPEICNGCKIWPKGTGVTYTLWIQSVEVK
jgi:hypothetical protein